MRKSDLRKFRKEKLSNGLNLMPVKWVDSKDTDQEQTFKRQEPVGYCEWLDTAEKGEEELRLLVSSRCYKEPTRHGENPICHN